LRREVELIGPGAVDVIATALVQPVGKLIARSKGGVAIGYAEIARWAHAD